MGYRIERTTVCDKVDQIWPLLERHAHELATHPHLMTLKPNLHGYQACENAGLLLALVVYWHDEIIGYSINVITNHMHYSDLLVVNNDVLFVAPEHRGTTIGALLIEATEKLAKDTGGRMMMWHVKPNTAMERLLPKLGYGVQDVVYSKEI